MANHTPGPWWWGGPEWPNTVYSQERHATAMVECNYRDGDDEDIANARLISAAPDLLAALEAVTDPLHQCEQCDDHYGMTRGCTPWAQVRAAVRKAKNLQSEEAWDEWCLSRWKAKEGEE